MLHRFETNTRARALVLALFAAASLALRAQAAEPEPVGQALTGDFVQNGGFADDLGGWEVQDPSVSWSALDAGNDTFSGSAQVDEPAPTDLVAVVALRQCLAVPAAGRYTLSASIYGGSLPRFAQDSLKLSWVTYADSPTCTGAPIGTGELFILGGSGWRTPSGPALLDFPPESWTVNTRVELFLVVERNANDPETSGIFGRFDKVAFKPYEDLFRTSYE